MYCLIILMCLSLEFLSLYVVVISKGLLSTPKMYDDGLCLPDQVIADSNSLSAIEL